MDNPQQFLESASHEEVSGCIVHQLTSDEQAVGAVLKTPHGYFWIDFLNEIHSNTFFRTIKETVEEFNLWLQADSINGKYSLN